MAIKLCYSAFYTCCSFHGTRLMILSIEGFFLYYVKYIKLNIDILHIQISTSKHPGEKVHKRKPVKIFIVFFLLSIFYFGVSIVKDEPFNIFIIIIPGVFLELSKNPLKWDETIQIYWIKRSKVRDLK